MPKAKKEQTFEDRLIEEFGERIMNNHTNEVKAISTGSVSLDASIGIGGIPRGMITELYGPEGSGKTTVALATAKSVVLEGGKVFYIDVENLLNPIIIRSILGDDFDSTNIRIVTPDSAEDAFMMAEMAIESKEFDLIVFDTVAAMASRKEKEVDFDKDTMMMLPRIISKFIKRNVYSIRINNIAVLILNQVRDNVGSYVKSYMSPGGHALKHQAAVRISLTKGEDLKRGDETVGIITKFVVRKNKVAPPFRSFTIPIVFGQGIDFFSDLIEFSELLGVLQKGGPYYKFGDKTLGQGKAQTIETLKNSKETLDLIKERVYNIVSRATTQVELLLKEEEPSVEEEGVLEGE